MLVDICRFSIDGPLLITPKRFSDARGVFSETYSAKALAEVGITCTFVQDNYSLSSDRGTVRGLHFQAPPKAQDKLIRVARGRILDIFVDVRRASPSYGSHGAAELSAENWQQIFIPKGFAHGYCTLEPGTEVLYKTSDYYAPKMEGGVLWNDPTLGIAWPDFAGANLSGKDQLLPLLGDLDSPFSFAV